MGGPHLNILLLLLLAFNYVSDINIIIVIISPE